MPNPPLAPLMSSTILSDLSVQTVSMSRIAEVDFNNLGFGTVFSDHMFSIHWRDGRWRNPCILPYGHILVDPANAALHYGQAVFEGLKAFRGTDGVIRIYRPDRNWRRLRDSCKRMCIPPLPEAVFLQAIDRLVALDSDWIPTNDGQALYIRPLLFSDEAHLEVRSSRRFRFLIMTSPVGRYFAKSIPAITLKAEDVYTRAAPGGIGSAKTAGNYAASLYPAEEARRQGYMQVLWLDSAEHQYIEEVGAMNIFFCLDGKVITPDLHGSILPGVTRDSVLTLLRETNHAVEERRIAISEIKTAAADGKLNEAFCAGTAVGILPISTIAYQDEEIRVDNQSAAPITHWLQDQITRIQNGQCADRHGWCRIVTV